MHSLLLVAALSAVPSPGSAEPAADIRGITLSTHRGGQDWSSDDLPGELVLMRELGANWIAIHPYARIGDDGSVSLRRRGREPPEHIVRPIREAKAAGMRILIKPHLAYWGSSFGWRGEIRFDDPERIERFWREYAAFIVDVARWSKDADGFVVGTELRQLEGEHARWRELIAATRRVTDAPLTYAANWDDFERIEFWDALDWIGVQAYFPLADESDSSRAAIEGGWSRWMARVNAHSRAHDRPVVFTELGYNQSYAAAATPWDYRTDDDGARDLQELCMSVALHAIEAEPSVVGVFLWKWFLPPRRVGRNFQLATPRMRSVIRKSWRASSTGLETAPR